MPAKLKPVRINGTNQDDFLGDESYLVPLRISGRKGNDTLVGGLSDDTILGGDGDDLIYSGGGGGLMDGGRGTDTLVLEGSIFDYTWVEQAGGKWEISILASNDDAPGLGFKRIEKVQFDDYFFQPEIDDEVILGAVDLTSDEDTMEFTFEAFDFDGDELQFVSAEILHSNGPIALEVIQELQWHPTIQTTYAEFIVGFAPLKPAEFFTWQYLAANEVAMESMEVTVSSTAADGTVSFFDVFFDITITGENDAPDATNVLRNDIFVPGRIVSIDLNDHFSDVDASDTHTFSLTQTGGDVIDHSFNAKTGLITFNDIAGAPSASFSWTVADNNGASDTATLDVTFTPPPGILIDFEEFSPDGGGLDAFLVSGVLSNGIQFSQFGTVVETDEANVTPGWVGFGLSANSPDDPDGDNVMVNGFRSTVWFFDPEGDNFDFESTYMTFLGNQNDGAATSGEVTFIAYDGTTPGGTYGEIGRQTFTITEAPALLEFDDTIFDSVDYVRIVPENGLRWGMDDMFLMPVEDVFI